MNECEGGCWRWVERGCQLVFTLGCYGTCVCCKLQSIARCRVYMKGYNGEGSDGNVVFEVVGGYWRNAFIIQMGIDSISVIKKGHF